MGKLLHRHNEYIIIEEDNGRGCVLINSSGTYKNHGHIKRLETALMMIRLIERGIVPKSNYLRGTALRVSTNEKYKAKVQRKTEKDKNKSVYRNINKGVVNK